MVGGYAHPMAGRKRQLFTWMDNHSINSNHVNPNTLKNERNEMCNPKLKRGSAPSCCLPYVADNDVQEHDTTIGGFSIVKHIVQKVDVIFLDLPVTTVLWNHIVCHNVDNKAIVSVEGTSNHCLFP